MRRYLRWYREGYLSSTGTCFDIGMTVSAALRRFEQTGNPFAGDTAPHAGGNGALMRIAPVLLQHLHHPSPALWADTALAAMLTHNDSASTAACLAFVRLLWELLGRETPPAPEWWLARYLETARELRAPDLWRGRFRAGPSANPISIRR